LRHAGIEPTEPSRVALRTPPRGRRAHPTQSGPLALSRPPRTTHALAVTADALLQVLPADECRRLLASAHIGRVVFTNAALPTALPVNYAMVGADIIFRSGPGLKLSAALAGTVVAFEVDDFNDDLRVGWSVVVTSFASVVVDPAEVAQLDRLGIPIWISAADAQYIRLTTDGQVTGRRLVPPHEASTECLPDRCPCDDQSCTLSRYVRATRAAAAASPSTTTASDDNPASLEAADQAVADRLHGLDIDMDAMAAVQNVNRAANAIRKRCERTVLTPQGLTWTAWIVLWAGWIWGDIETRHLAYEAGISKPTLTWVLSSLEARGLLQRRPYPDDARRVLVSLTPEGQALMTDLLPRINAQERLITDTLSGPQTTALARQLRTVVARVEALQDAPQADA